VPTDVDKQVGTLKELHAARFEGVEREFVLRQLSLQIETKTGALSDKSDELRNRLNIEQGKGAGQGQSWAFATAAIGVLLGIGGLAAALVR
jgi:hypothetical protein